MTTIESLILDCELLLTLLRDPHPGLAVWQDAVAAIRERIANRV